MDKINWLRALGIAGLLGGLGACGAGVNVQQEGGSAILSDAAPSSNAQATAPPVAVTTDNERYRACLHCAP